RTRRRLPSPVHPAPDSEDPMPKTITRDAQPGTASPFGPDFEPGSDGSVQIPPPRQPAQPTSLPAARFQGTGTVTDDRALLTAGGIEVELLAAELLPGSDTDLRAERARAVGLFKPYQGQNVTVRGEQQGDTILHAVPVAKSVKTTSRFDEA